MGELKERIANAVSLARKRAEDQKALSLPLDGAALSRLLGIREFEDLATTCFGLIRREHYSPETTGRIIGYSKALLAKATQDGKKMKHKEYTGIVSELDQLKQKLPYLDKRQESGRATLLHFTDVALDCIIKVSDGALKKEHEPEAKAEMQTLKAIATALKTLLPKPR